MCVCVCVCERLTVSMLVCCCVIWFAVKLVLVLVWMEETGQTGLDSEGWSDLV